MQQQIIISVAAGGMIVIALYTDLRWRRIPNGLTVTAAACAFFCHVLAGGVQDGGLFALKGLLAGIGLFLVPFLLGAMGGGDVKLFGALGAWLGLGGILTVALFAAVAGGVMALTILLARGGFGRLRHLYDDALALLLTRRRLEPDASARRVPYTIPCALGFVVFLVRTFWIRANS